MSGDPAAERTLLRALFAALEEPARGRALPDGAETLGVARRHRLTPLLSIHCRGHLPAELERTCRRDHIITTARNLALAQVAEECVAALAAEGVESALLKGLAYEGTLYEQPGARPTSDIDLLVRDRDRAAAFGVLDRLGFSPRAAAPGFDEPDYHEVAWRRGGVEIDLHMALAPYVRCSIDYDELWRQMRPLALGATRAFVLAPAHAAAFHALHMAIDHFDVPGLYLIDLTRLAPDADALEAARATARAWRCRRPLATSVALARTFCSSWTAAPEPASAFPADRVVASFGGVARVPRGEQLLRKFAHFDGPGDAVRYTAVQGRRHLRELFERHVRRRSPGSRLHVGE